MLVNEGLVRLAAFGVVFAAMALWELAAPRRRSGNSRFKRWPSSLAVVPLDTGLLRCVLPATAVSLAMLGARQRWGLLNYLPL